MNRTLGLLGTILFIATSNSGFGQNSRAAADQRLADTSGAFSLGIPGGWKSSSGADGFALADSGGKILIAITRHNYKDFLAFAAEANLERDGLEMVGKPQAIANGQTFRAVKRTPEGTLMVDTSVLFSRHGGGVLIAAMSSEADANAGFDAGLKVAGSVLFSKPQPAAAGGQPGGFLSGKHLLYFYTASGYSERKDIYLCASGGFYQSTGLGGFTPNDADGSSFGSESSRHEPGT